MVLFLRFHLGYGRCEVIPSIPHEAGLKALEKALNNRTNKTFSTKNLVKMATFILKNNYFEFNSKVKHQISGTAIGTKFDPSYACIFMHELKTSFLETRNEGFSMVSIYRCVFYLDPGTRKT